jgi:hypothetical protein
MADKYSVQITVKRHSVAPNGFMSTKEVTETVSDIALLGDDQLEALQQGANHYARLLTNYHNKVADAEAAKAKVTRQADYPRPDGENVILGPNTVLSGDEAVINFKGDNYYRNLQQDWEEDSPRNRRVQDIGTNELPPDQDPHAPKGPGMARTDHGDRAEQPFGDYDTFVEKSEGVNEAEGVKSEGTYVPRQQLTRNGPVHGGFVFVENNATGESVAAPQPGSFEKKEDPGEHYYDGEQ